MAHVVHQHHVETFELPSGLYWAAGIILGLLAFVLIYFSTTTSTDLAPVSASLPEPPTVPLFW